MTLAHLMKSEGYNLHLLSYNYGQRHKKELEFAKKCAERLDAQWTLVDLSGIQLLLAGSALTSDEVAVPEGHYSAESMKATVVPNRNSIMLAIAWGHAVSIGAEVVCIGVHAGDHTIYPDCRPEFIELFERTENVANEGFGAMHLEAPFLYKNKADIVKIGSKLGVPYAETWSCYVGKDIHCARCGTCVERIEAFYLANVTDPTVYERGF